MSEENKPESEKKEVVVQDEIKCKYCADPNPKIQSHLVCIETLDEEGEPHVHVHGPFENRLAMYRILNAVEEELAKHKRGDAKTKAEGLL